MATITRVQLLDDIDGQPAEETLGFGLDGVHYEIDLSGKNAAALRQDLEPWLDKARRTSGKKIPRRLTKKASAPAPTSPPAAAPAAGDEPEDARGSSVPAAGPAMRTTVLPAAKRPLDAGDRRSLKKFAAARGFKIPGDKGRIAAALMEAWDAAGRPK